MAVLDTNALIAVERGHAGALRVVDAQFQAGSQLRIPAIVWLEFLCYWPTEQRRVVESSLNASAIFMAFDADQAGLAAQIQHESMVAGKRLGWNDVQIAAAALRTGEPLISNDQGFDRIPGLKRIGF